MGCSVLDRSQSRRERKSALDLAYQIIGNYDLLYPVNRLVKLAGLAMFGKEPLSNLSSPTFATQVIIPQKPPPFKTIDQTGQNPYNSNA